MRIVKIAFVFIFIILLFNQFIIDLIQIPYLNFTMNKNKVYQQFSSKEDSKNKRNIFQKINQVKNNLDNFYANNLALKPLFKHFILIKHNLFDIKNPYAKKVIEGIDGWYFLGNSYSDVVDEYKGYKLFNDIEVERIENNMLAVQNMMAKKNIKIYFTIAPNKHTVYSEYFPIKKYKEESKMNQLVKKLKKNKKINFINLYPTLMKNKLKDRVYYKTDSHWNSIGAYKSYKHIMKRLKRDYPQLNFLKEKELRFKENIKTNGGNTEMLGLKIKETVLDYRVKKYKSKTLPKKLKVPENYDRIPSRYEKRFLNNEKEINVLFYHDSFGQYLLKFMREDFKYLTCLTTYDYNKDIIEKENPDIIIIEVVERVLENWVDLEIK